MATVLQQVYKAAALLQQSRQVAWLKSKYKRCVWNAQFKRLAYARSSPQILMTFSTYLPCESPTVISALW
jgi:hypothetical protein